MIWILLYLLFPQELVQPGQGHRGVFQVRLPAGGGVLGEGPGRGPGGCGPVFVSVLEPQEESGPGLRASAGQKHPGCSGELHGGRRSGRGWRWRLPRCPPETRGEPGDRDGGDQEDTRDREADLPPGSRGSEGSPGLH